MKVKKFTFYTDPGHGWLKVDREVLEATMDGNDISTFSYARGRWVFLEEDADAPKFIKAYEEKYGCKVAITHKKQASKSSKIRGYDRYICSKPIEFKEQEEWPVEPFGVYRTDVFN